MTHLDPVLVGVDGSRAGPAAIRFAAHEALRQGTSIRLVHMVPNYVPITPMLPLAPSDLEAAGRELLREATAEAHKYLDPTRVEASLHYGPRVPTLLELAEHARLVVIGSQQRPAVERLFTGSTLFGLASRATVPVVAVPRTWSPTAERHRIVVGVKSVDHSPELVRRALQIAADRSAEVVLVHAWGLPTQYDDLVTARVDQAEWTDRAQRAIERCLQGVQETSPEVPVEIRVVHGQPARVLQLASDDADLLLLARRHSGFPFGHLGGTGRVLLHEAHCPVEVVPPADEPTDTSDLVLERAGSLQK
jgi:nucleotide-binding universal stress UspA family protein